MSESRRRRLERLTQSIARGDFAAASDVLRDAAGKPRPKEQRIVKPLTILQACPGVERLMETDMGRCPMWLIRRTLSDVSPDEAGVSREYFTIMRGARERFDELEASVGLCHAADANPEELLFMDIESCGFSGSCVFLIGVMFYDTGEDQIVFEQYLARNYAEERAVMQAFCDRYNECRLLVTFNGKSFDINMIRERSAFHGVLMPDREPPHLDLLHESRRHWKTRLPNCRLQTLERYMCGRVRVGDIPGAQIPDAYHGFVNSGDARALRDILHHNLLDMLTMAQLLCVMLTGCEPDNLPPITPKPKRKK